MKHYLRLILSILSFSLLSQVVDAQSCYKLIRSEGIQFYEDRNYLDALDKFELAADCVDLPRKNDLEKWKARCTEGIRNLIVELKATVLNLNNVTADNYLINADRLIKERDYNSAKLYSLYALDFDTLSGDRVKRASNTINFYPDLPVSVFRPSFYHRIHTFEVSPVAPILVTIPKDYLTLYLWDYETEELISVLPSFSANTVTFSPDGKLLAVGGRNSGLIQVWDIEKKETIAFFNMHSARINRLVFSSDNNKLASASTDKKVFLWDIAEQTLIDSITNHSASVTSIDFSKDGRFLASSSRDRTIRVYDTLLKSERFASGQQKSIINEVFFSKNTGMLISCANNHEVKQWDFNTSKDSVLIKSTESHIQNASFRKLDDHLMALTTENRIELWLENQTTDYWLWMDKGWINAITVKEPKKNIEKVVFSPFGDAFFSLAANDNTIKIWNLTENYLYIDSTTQDIKRYLADTEQRFNLKKEGTELLSFKEPYEQAVEDMDQIYEDSIKILDYLDLYPIFSTSRPDLLYQIGLSYYNQKKYQNAQRFLRQFVEKVPHEPQGWRLLSMAATNMYKYDNALSAMKKATELSPYDDLLWIDLGFIYNYRTYHEETKDCLEKALELNPNNPNYFIYYQLGQYYERIQEKEKAISFYKKTLEIAPNYSEAITSIGLLHAKNKAIEEAILFAQRANNLNLNDEWTYIFIGEIYRESFIRTQDSMLMNKAMTAYEKAFSINPNNPVCMVGLGIGYYALNDYANTKQYLEQAYKLSAYSSDVALNLVEYYVDYEKEYGRSNRMLDTILQQFPNEWYAQALKGQIFAATGEYKKALSYFESALALSDDPYIQKNIAYVYLKLKKEKLAKEYLDLASAQLPYDKWVLRNTACYHAAKNDKKLALETLQQAIEAGYEDIDWLETETLLDNLRRDNTYKKMIQKLKDES